MQEQAHDNLRANHHSYSSSTSKDRPEPVKANPKDYIDFEEIKE